MFNDLARPARLRWLARRRLARRASRVAAAATRHGLALVLALAVLAAFLITSAHAAALLATL